MTEKHFPGQEFTEAQIAVLIDYENVGLGSIQPLFDQLSDLGRIIIKRAYADWSTAGGKRDQLLELGIEAVHHFRSSGSGKNSSDIALTIAAVDLLHNSPVDTFVIVSSDSDFVSLVSKLRAAGKRVIGAGRKSVASKTLITACDRFIDLDAPQESVKSPGPNLRKDAEDLLIRAVNASADPQGQVSGTKLYQTMLRLDPSFDYRALGSRKFTQFLRSSKKVRISRESAQGDVTVELASYGRLIEASGEGSLNVPDWDQQIDEAWSKRPGVFLPGPWAASEAARVLKIPKLSASPYQTLQGLLDASEYLKSRWYRDGNAILRRGVEQPRATS